MRLTLYVLALVLAGCAGSPGGSCYGNGTCDKGLNCVKLFLTSDGTCMKAEYVRVDERQVWFPDGGTR